MEIIQWLKEHYQDILAIIGGIVTVCSIITKLTPNTTDDGILAKIIKVLSALGIFNPDGSITK